MKVLLTGANGQVGWEAAAQARERGIPLTAMTREELDITDASAVGEKINDLQPSIVINAAAYTAVDKAEEEAEQAFAVNRDGAAHLAAACGEQNIPLIHISTDYVFGGNKGAPYVESDPAKPVNVYGRSKLEGEQATRDRLAAHLILRTSWVFGSHGKNFVKTVLRLAQNGGPLRIVEDQTGAPTSAASIAHCTLELAQKYLEEGDLPWGTHHFTGSPHTSWHGFATEILRQATALGIIQHPPEVLPIPTRQFPTPAKRPHDTRLTTERNLFTPPDWRPDLTVMLRTVSNL